jgi:hypothetical protein
MIWFVFVLFRSIPCFSSFSFVGVLNVFQFKVSFKSIKRLDLVCFLFLNNANVAAYNKYRTRCEFVDKQYKCALLSRFNSLHLLLRMKAELTAYPTMKETGTRNAVNEFANWAFTPGSSDGDDDDAAGVDSVSDECASVLEFVVFQQVP